MKHFKILLAACVLLLAGVPFALAAEMTPQPAPLPAQSQDCAIDLMFVLDSSSSIISSDFYTVMETWTKDLVQRFTLGADAAKVGVIQFSSDTKLEVGLSDDLATINNGIDHMVKFDQGTRIDLGLQEAHNEFNRNGRAGAPRIIILLTDGVSEGDPIRVADQLRADENGGVTILGVAVGGIDLGQIIAIAGGEYNVVQVAEFEGLNQILSILHDYSCAVATEGTSTASLSQMIIQATTTPNVPDSDFDGVVDTLDNCPTVSNFDQSDSNTNGIGDACDGVAQPSNNAQPTPIPNASTSQPAVATPLPVVPATATPLPTQVAVVPVLPADLAGGTYIAFSSTSDGDSEIFTINPDGGALQQLTNNTTTDDKPDISPDGKLMAWESNQHGTFDIWVMNADGTNSHAITDNTSQDWGPAWSPDGSQIAFHSLRDANTEVWVMNADGSNPHRITHGSTSRSPEWSPDGQKLVFYSDRDEGRELYIIDVNTGEEQKMTENEVYDGEPDWSPAGTRIVFASTRTSEEEFSNICLINPDGSNVTCLPVRGTDDDPAWSPDGNYIVFESGLTGNFDLWVMRPDGSDLQQLTNSPARDWSADWGIKP